ncbi:hypothetical protein B566_EDAN000775 [Ephemera danica]|nr:hypothetical protein B566_EDAN000775 [Ephemera danica]
MRSYSGEALELNDADNTLGVLRASQNLQVYSAVTYCAEKLRSMIIDATSVCQILDFALQINDYALKKACMKVMREETDSVLISNSFLNCSIDTLKLILSQEVVHAVTELDLFLACCRWSKKYKNPKQAIGSALGLIRFRVFTKNDFMSNVIQPRNLLTEYEGIKIWDYIVDGKDNIPRYFSKETCTRKLFLKDDEVGALQMGTDVLIKLLETGHPICMTHEQIRRLPPLQFSVNVQTNLMAVEVWSFASVRTNHDTYMEDIDIILTNGDGKVIATATFNGEVKFASYFQIRFQRPVPISPDVIYSLRYINNVSNVRHLTWECEQHTYKTGTNLEIRILNQVSSVIRELILSPNVNQSSWLSTIMNFFTPVKVDTEFYYRRAFESYLYANMLTQK